MLTVLEDKLIEPEFTKPLRSIDIQEGSTLNLECEVVGFPEPTVLWKKDNFPIKSSAECVIIAHENSHSILIYRPQKKHSGQYTCEAQNSAGHKLTTAYVNVVGKL